MAGKPKFLFAGDGGNYEDFEKKLLFEISKAGLTTEFKKKSFLYKHLAGDVLNTLTKLLFPIKLSDKSFEELLVSLNTHYIPNKHLRERVLFYARIQEENEQTKDFFESLKSIASRCKYNDAELKLVLCDKVLTGIRCPRLRESLFAAGISPSCTAEQYMEYALQYEINVNKEKLAKEKKINEKNKKLTINKNIDPSPNPNDKKAIPDSPAAKFGVSLKKGNDNNNNNKNGNKGPVNWKPKVPLTPESTFGVTLKSKSSIQVSPTTPPVQNGTDMPSPKPMTIPEIMEIVKEPRKPAFSRECNKIILNKKSAPQREPSWSPSPSPEPRTPVAITPEAKKILDKHTQNKAPLKSQIKEPPKPAPKREPSWSPSPSPEPKEIKSQVTRGRSSVKDTAPKMKRSNSTLSVRDKPLINESSNNTNTPAPKLKRSSSTVSLTRNSLPEGKEPFDPMRSLRQGLAALKSVKHLKPEPEKTTRKDQFDMSDRLPKLRSVGGGRKSPTEIPDFLDEIPEITDFTPRKPTLTPEAKAIVDKYLNRAPPEPPKPRSRREPSYSPSPEPEPKPDLTKKPLVNKCAKPTSNLPNKSMSYSDLTKSDLFENFLQAKSSQTSAQKGPKSFKINKPAKKDEVPQLTDEVRRKLEEKYGVIKAKPKEPIIEESVEQESDNSLSKNQQNSVMSEEKIKEPIIEDSSEQVTEDSLNKNQQSSDVFKEKTKESIVKKSIEEIMGMSPCKNQQSRDIVVVKPSDRVVQMYKESQQVKEALKEATNTDQTDEITTKTSTAKPILTVKASPKIAEMYKVQVMDRDKSKCPSPPPEKNLSTITKFADKKWVSTLDLSSSRKEYDTNSFRTPKSSRRREPSWSPSVSPEPKDNKDQSKNDSPKPYRRRDSYWSRSVSPEPKNTRDQSKKDSPKSYRMRDPNWSPSVSPEPKNNSDQLKKESPTPYRRRDPNWSPSLSPEPQNNRHQLNKDFTKPSIIRDPYWSPSVSPEPKDTREQSKKDSIRSSIRSDPYWSPSVSPEPNENKGRIKNEYSNTSSKRDPNWSPSPSPEPSKIKSHFKRASPIRRDPYWSPSPSPEPRDTRSQDNRGRSSGREPAVQLKRSCSNFNVNSRDKSSTMKRSCSSTNISRNSKILNEIPEIPENIEPRKSCLTSESKSTVDKYWNKAQMKLNAEREPSYSPSPEPESGSDLTREQLFEKYAKPSNTSQAKSSSYLDLTKSDIFDKFLKAKDSSSTFSKVKKQVTINKKSKKEEVKELTDEDRRKLEEKYGIIRGKPKDPKAQVEEAEKRKKSPSRAQQSRKLFQEIEKAAKTLNEVQNMPDIIEKIEPRESCITDETKRIVDKYLNKSQNKETDKDEQNSNTPPSNTEKANGGTPKTPNEKPTVIIKSPSSVAEKYKAELEKQNQKPLQRSFTEKAVATIARHSDKRSSLDLTPLDISRLKKEHDAESLKKEALKYNVKKECKYNAEMDYGDSLLKVTEKDTFNVRTIKTEFFQQDRADSPGMRSLGNSPIPPKPGSAAAAKPQFDISSFFDGSSYSNFLQSAKSTKGGTK